MSILTKQFANVNKICKGTTLEFELERTPGAAAVKRINGEGELVDYQFPSPPKNSLASPNKLTPLPPPLCSTVAIPPTMPDVAPLVATPCDGQQPLPYDVVVGYDKLRQLLQPAHPYFRDKGCYIDRFEQYRHGEDDEHCLLYPRLKGKVPYATRNNPYRKHQLSRSHGGRTSSQIQNLIATQQLSDARFARIVWTVPAELSRSLAKMGQRGRNMFWNCFKRIANDDIPRVVGVSGELSSLVNLHVWKTEAPLESHFHFHQMLWNYAVDADSKFRKWFGTGIGKDYSVDGKARRGCVPVSDKELVQLKECWVTRLQAMCKRNKIPGDCLDGVKIDVFIDYDKWDASGRNCKVISHVAYQKRAWLEDYALYSNEHLDCSEPPVWLLKYDNRSRCLGWWARLSDYGGTPERGERVSPFTGRPMIYAQGVSVVGLLYRSKGILGGMAHTRGEAKIWKLAPVDYRWLAEVSAYDDVAVREFMGRSGNQDISLWQ